MDTTPEPSPTPYVECFSFTPQAVWSLLASAGFCALALTLPNLPWLIKALMLVFFGGGGLLTLAKLIVGGPALRVDPQGVTLSLGTIISPPGRWAASAFVPWRDLREIVLFDHAVHAYGTIRIPYIGLALRPDAPLPTSLRRGGLAGVAARPGLTPPVGIQVVRQISGWRVDPARVQAAVAAHAPEVQIVESAS